VIDRIFWGDTDDDGVASDTAWQRLGVDLDDVQFAKPTSPGHCSLYGAPSGTNGVEPDGPGGVDDAWARHVFPAIVALSNDSPGKLKAAIDSGRLTYALRFDALGSGDATAVSSQLFVVTGPLDAEGATAPAPHDGSPYVWHPFSNWLSDAATPTSAIRRDDGWVSDGRWVSGGTMDVPMILAYDQNQTLRFVVHRARILATLADGELVHGRIVGVVGVDEFEQAVDDLAGNLKPIDCFEEIDGIAEQIKVSADMLLDGTQDPTKVCDGISFGIGFHAVRGEVGNAAPPLPTGPGCPGH
jgi:hypothetical protein